MHRSDTDHSADYRAGITSDRWRRLRRDVLSRHPMCQRCQDEGRLTPATEVHHVRPVEDGTTKAERARLLFVPHNLRALCHSCHLATHLEMGRGGKQGNRRRVAAELAKLSKYLDSSDD